MIETKYGNIKVLYEDEDVIALVKPVGLLSQGAENSSEESLLDVLDGYFAGRAQAYPVHRLDRTTAGVMLVAKNKRAAGALSALASGGGMKKEYLAVVHGHAGGGILDDMIFFDRGRAKAFVVDKNTKRSSAKRALLEYESLAFAECDAGEVSLIRVRLMTGRTHQIRVQMSHAGHALLGDGKYGGRDNKCRSALFSHKISFSPEAFETGYLKGRKFSKAILKGELVLSESPSGYPFDLFNR